jgi:potassium channel subfamily K
MFSFSHALLTVYLLTHYLSPIMASFAVQAIQNILEQISQRRMDQRRASIVQNNKGDPENNSDKDEIDEEHSTLVLRHHLHKQKAEANGEVTIPASDLEALLEHSLALERITRRLLVAHLEEGTRAQILLRADWNLQLRNMQALEAEMKKQDSRLRNNDRPNGMHKKETNEMLAMGSGISKKSETREEHEESEFTKKAVGGMGDEETLNEVREFREHVAGMLAVGSRLRGLEVRYSVLVLFREF